MAERAKARKVESIPAFEVPEFAGRGDARCLCSAGARVCLSNCFSLSCTGNNVVESYLSTGFRDLTHIADYQLASSRDFSAIEAINKDGVRGGACLCSPNSLELCSVACNSMSCFGADVVKQYLKQ